MLFVHLPWGAQFVVFPEDSQSLGPCRIEPAPTPIAYLEAAKSSNPWPSNADIARLCGLRGGGGGGEGCDRSEECDGGEDDA